MQPTWSTLTEVLSRRVAVLPQKFLENPVRTVALEALRQRNVALDALFYDVGVITSEEAESLSYLTAREGMVMFVPPSGQGTLKLCVDWREFVQNHGKAVRTLAVAGVGSSALGSAAFARNVADAQGAPVAAVVSGYGLADVVTEAMGGYFWFGALNSVRHAFEWLDRVTGGASAATHMATDASSFSLAKLSPDTQVIINLLKADGIEFDMLIGHSKGNLVISEALYSIDLEDKSLSRALAKNTNIVTVSAKIGMPYGYQVADVMGEWDHFGEFNSRRDIKADFIVPGAWHSTNTQFPRGMGIDVKSVLQEHVLPMLKGGLPKQPRLKAQSLGDLPQLAVSLSALGLRSRPEETAATSAPRRVREVAKTARR